MLGKLKSLPANWEEVGSGGHEEGLLACRAAEALSGRRIVLLAKGS